VLEEGTRASRRTSTRPAAERFFVAMIRYYLAAIPHARFADVRSGFRGGDGAGPRSQRPRCCSRRRNATSRRSRSTIRTGERCGYQIARSTPRCTGAHGGAIPPSSRRCRTGGGLPRAAGEGGPAAHREGDPGLREDAAHGRAGRVRNEWWTGLRGDRRAPPDAAREPGASRRPLPPPDVSPEPAHPWPAAPAERGGRRGGGHPAGSVARNSGGAGPVEITWEYPRIVLLEGHEIMLDTLQVGRYRRTLSGAGGVVRGGPRGRNKRNTTRQRRDRPRRDKRVLPKFAPTCPRLLA